MTENKGLLGEKVVNGNLGIGSQFVCENHIIIIAFPNGRSIDNEEKTSETMSIPLSSTQSEKYRTTGKKNTMGKLRKSQSL